MRSLGLLKCSNLQIVLLCSILIQNIGFNYFSERHSMCWLERFAYILSQIFSKVNDTHFLSTLGPHYAINCAFFTTYFILFSTYLICGLLCTRVYPVLELRNINCRKNFRCEFICYTFSKCEHYVKYLQNNNRGPVNCVRETNSNKQVQCFMAKLFPSGIT